MHDCGYFEYLSFSSQSYRQHKRDFSLTWIMRLFKYLHHQRYLGLNDLEFSNFYARYSLSATWLSYLMRILIQGSLLISFLSIIQNWSLNYVEFYSESINLFDHIVILAGATTQFLVNLWMYLCQDSQLNFVNRLTHVARKLRLKNLETPGVRWLYRLWVLISTYYGIDIFVYAFYDLGLDRKQIIFLPGFFLRVFCANFIITCYCSLLLGIKYLIRTLTSLLESHETNGCQKSANDLAMSLYLYDQIQSACQEISHTFGIALLLIYLHSTLDATETYFLALPQECFCFLRILLLLRWLAPSAIYMSIPLLINNLATEVSVTIILLIGKVDETRKCKTTILFFKCDHSRSTIESRCS